MTRAVRRVGCAMVVLLAACGGCSRGAFQVGEGAPCTIGTCPAPLHCDRSHNVCRLQPVVDASTEDAWQQAAPILDSGPLRDVPPASAEAGAADIPRDNAPDEADLARELRPDARENGAQDSPAPGDTPSDAEAGTTVDTSAKTRLDTEAETKPETMDEVPRDHCCDERADAPLDVPADAPTPDKPDAPPGILPDTPADAPSAPADVPAEGLDTSLDVGTDAIDGVPSSPTDVDNPVDVPNPWQEIMPFIVLWLEASTGVEVDDQDLVLRWRDQTTPHNDAFPRGNSPTLIRDAGQGHPAVSFGLTGSDIHGLTVADHPSLNWGLSDFWALVVARSRQTTTPTSAPNSMGALFARTDPWNYYFGISLVFNSPETVTAGLFASTGFDQLFHPGGGLADNKMHLFVLRRHGLELALRVDGQDLETRTLNEIVDLSMPAKDFSIGVDPWGPGNQLEGEIYEILFVAAPTLEVQLLSQVESSLFSKYALPQ